jgi:hypothetical protein
MIPDVLGSKEEMIPDAIGVGEEMIPDVTVPESTSIGSVAKPVSVVPLGTRSPLLGCCTVVVNVIGCCNCRG